MTDGWKLKTGVELDGGPREPNRLWDVATCLRCGFRDITKAHESPRYPAHERKVPCSAPTTTDAGTLARERVYQELFADREGKRGVLDSEPWCLSCDWGKWGKDSACGCYKGFDVEILDAIVAYGKRQRETLAPRMKGKIILHAKLFVASPDAPAMYTRDDVFAAIDRATKDSPGEVDPDNNAADCGCYVVPGAGMVMCAEHLAATNNSGEVDGG